MIIISFLSLVLEGIISMLIGANSLLIPLFSIISLVVIFPFMLNEKVKFLIYSVILGLIYDLVYTQTLFLNTIVFFLIALIIILFFKYLPINLVNSIVVTTILISLYRIIIYGIICLANLLDFNSRELFKSIYSSLIINYIYIFILYFCLKKYNQKSKFHRQKKYKFQQKHTYVRKNY